MLTDYLPPPEIVYQLESHSEPFERIRIPVVEEQPLPNPKETLLGPLALEESGLRQNPERILLTEYNNNLLAQNEHTSTPSSQREPPATIAIPSSPAPFGTRLLLL